MTTTNKTSSPLKTTTTNGPHTNVMNLQPKNNSPSEHFSLSVIGLLWGIYLYTLSEQSRGFNLSQLPWFHVYDSTLAQQKAIAENQWLSSMSSTPTEKKRCCDKLFYHLFSILPLSSFSTCLPLFPPPSFNSSSSLLLWQCPNVTVAIATQVLRPGSFPASPAVLEGILGYVVPKHLIIQGSH